MLHWRACCAIAALSALSARQACAADTPTDADIIQSFEAQIAQLDSKDPSAPPALEAHLRYAQYLTQQTGDDCSSRLTAAESQLQVVQGLPALGVVLPQGLARAADIAYQIHAALADCGDPSDTARRERELRSALTFAQRSADLYQDIFDYPAMLTMLFNVAVTYQSLGDTAAARGALKAVLEADRQFGFSDDAEENYKQLAHLLPDDNSALVWKFPHRTTTLKFAWASGNNGITLKSESSRVSGNAILHATGDRTLTRQVRDRSLGWIVTYQSLASHYSLDPLPAKSDLEPTFVSSLAGMLTQFHDFALRSNAAYGDEGATADFEQTVNNDGFKHRVEQEALAYSLPSESQQGSTAVLAPVLRRRLKDYFWPAIVDMYTALDYNLETGAWPGATLEQGQWYAMDLKLQLPFAPLDFVLHHVQFTFTRELPCNGAAYRTCVELVLRAVPDEKELKYALRGLQHHMSLSRGQTLHSSSTIYMRLVTDPSTLQAYLRDTRQSFYVSIEGAPNAPVSWTQIGADRSLIDSGPITPAIN